MMPKVIPSTGIRPLKQNTGPPGRFPSRRERRTEAGKDRFDYFFAAPALF
jgi:hypothetical protein